MAWEQKGLCTFWCSILDRCGGLFVKLWNRYVACIPLLEDTEVGRMSCKPFSEPVPEDILIEIFSRMPAECLHQCKQAYEDWNTLCSTSHFNHNLFLQRASPTIIVHRGSLTGHKLFYVDDDNRGGLKSTQISLGDRNMPLDHSPSWLPINQFTPVKFTCYGLIFLEAAWPHKNMSGVINPVTRKAAFLSHHFKVEGDICGAFFHPAEREFRVLWVSSWKTLNEKTYVVFELLRPRSKSHPQLCWKALSRLKYRPVINEPPVNLHERLHWMCWKLCTGYSIQSIMVFDVVKEEFTLMPSISNVQPSIDKLMHILDLDGYLSLWKLTDVLNIWTKEDYYASCSWTKRYSIEVKLLHKKINIDEVSVVGFQNGALVIHWIGKGILVYHLQNTSTKKFLFDKFKEDQCCFTSIFLHTKTVISMTGFTLDAFKHRDRKSVV